MTLNTGIFDVSDPLNPDRVYSAALLSRILSKHIRDGVVHDDGNEMAVTVTDPPAMSVQVGTGTAMVRGRFCENDAALTLSVPAAHATYPRIDRVVVRLNASPGRTIDIVVKPGTAAPEPAAPALTRTAETWELSLAQVRVEAGATSILSAKIADERGSASLCGVACPAYVPSSVLEIVEGLTMQGMPLVGLPAPGSSSAAATKAYVDSVISGFGISDITIDADKDWQGQDIINVGDLRASSLAGPAPGSAIEVGSVTAVAGDTLRAASDSQVHITTALAKRKEIVLPADLVGQENTYRILFDIAPQFSELGEMVQAQVYVNGVPRGTLWDAGSGGWITRTEDISGLSPGDSIQLYAGGQFASSYPADIRNFRLCAEYEVVFAPKIPTHTVVL